MLLSSIRHTLRQAPNYPAFTTEWCEKAELLLSTSTDPAQLSRWERAAVKESEAWEGELLQREEAQSGPPAYPEYRY